jgi:hypothetical protein
MQKWTFIAVAAVPFCMKFPRRMVPVLALITILAGAF